MSNLEQLLEELIEATGAADREQQIVAEMFFDKVRKFLGSTANRRKLLKAELDDGGTGLAFAASAVDKRFDDLFFVLLPSHYRPPGSMRPSNDMPGKTVRIDLSVLPKTPVGRLKKVDIGKLEVVFIHEFVHYLDSKRRKGKQLQGKAAITGSSAYFNSPSEFNAYYQGGASNLVGALDILAKRGQSKNIDAVLKNFDAFIDFATKFSGGETFNRKWIKGLDNKYRRKFLLRAHKLYSDLVDKYTRKIR